MVGRCVLSFLADHMSTAKHIASTAANAVAELKRVEGVVAVLEEKHFARWGHDGQS